MSSQYYGTFQSSSYSSNSDGTGNTYTEATSSYPSGTTVHRSFKEAGQPTVSETTRIPASGGNAQVEGFGNNRRIDDVTDNAANADQAYDEPMEEVYAKREGSV